MALSEEMRAEMSELKAGLERAERRAAAAEGQARRAVTVSVAIASVAVIMGLAVPGQGQVSGAARRGSTVRAPFRIVDNRGKVLLQVKATPGGGSLTLNDHQGKPFIIADNLLDHESEGVTSFRRLAVLDEAGVGRVQMSDLNLTQGNARGFAVFDEEDRRLFELGSGGAGHIGLRITHPSLADDGTLQPALSVGVNEDGSRGLTVNDDTGQRIMDLGLDPDDGVRGVDIHNFAGQRVGAMSVSESGNGELRLFNAAGQTTFTAP